ncbi:MAG TPA: acyl carrier protein [Gemmataceae bacterium]|nr:acyl carrier protein [Gemmataceae bacterium]
MTEREAIVAKLAEVLEAETGVSAEPLRGSEDLPLRDGLNIDSVDLIGAVMRIEEFYRIRLTQEELAKVVTVRDLVDLVLARTAAPVARAA